MKRLCAVATLCVSLAVSVSAAGADQSAAIENAETVLKEAVAAFDGKDFETARLKFATAYGLVPSVDILWSLAVSEFESGHLADALRRFRQYVRDPKARPQRVEEARRDYMPKAIAQTGHIEVFAPDGAAIFIDGKLHIGNCPLPDPIDVPPGHHDIVAKIEGKPAVTVATDTVAGSTIRVSILGGATKRRPADSAAGAPGDPQGNGSNGLTLNGDQVNAPKGSMAKRNVTTAVLVGGGLVAIGAGVFFGLQSASDRDRADQLRATAGGCQGSTSAPCLELADTTSTQSTNATLSDVFLVGGGVLAAAGVITFLVWPKAKTQSAWVRPGVAPGVSSLVFGGSF